MRPGTTHRARRRSPTIGQSTGAGSTCALLQAPPNRVATFMALGGCGGPRLSVGTREENHQRRASTPRCSRYHEVVHQDVPIPRQAQNRYGAQDAKSPQVRRQTTSLGLSRKTGHSRQAQTPGHPLSGCLQTSRLKGDTQRTPSFRRPQWTGRHDDDRLHARVLRRPRGRADRARYSSRYAFRRARGHTG